MNIFKKIIQILFRHDKESEQKRKLKELAKEIKHSSCSNFYRVKTREVTPELGYFFYNLYKPISEANKLFHSARESKILKLIFLECCMNEEQTILWNHFAVEYIKKMVADIPHNEITRRFELDTQAFFQVFDEQWIQNTDKQYNLLLDSIWLLSFDYLQLLKCFDPAVDKQTSKNKPRFTPAPVTAVLESLKDFLSIIMCMDFAYDWSIVLTTLKRYKENAGIKPELWSMFLRRIQALKNSKILPLIIKHGSRDVQWTIKPYNEGIHIAKRLVETKHQDAHNLLSRFIREQYISQVDNLLQSLFGTAGELICVHHYTIDKNELYAAKQIGTFNYTKALNYVKTFIFYYYSGMMEICDFLVIKGSWSSREVSKEFSEDIYNAEDIPSRLERFENSLGEQGVWGLKLKDGIDIVDIDKTKLPYIQQVVKQVNKEALDIITATRKSLIMLGKHVKNLHDDHKKQQDALIHNWEELELEKDDLQARLIDSYKKIALFAHLIRLIVENSQTKQEEAENEELSEESDSGV